MVKHVILWTFKDTYCGAQIDELRLGRKEGLEGLQGKIPGLIDIKVQTDGILNSSNADLMLVSTFVDEAALKAYQNNPLHVAVANEKVRPFVAGRVCIDYVI